MVKDCLTQFILPSQHYMILENIKTLRVKYYEKQGSGTSSTYLEKCTSGTQLCHITKPPEMSVM